jgi:hypothetical protein
MKSKDQQLLEEAYGEVTLRQAASPRVQSILDYSKKVLDETAETGENYLEALDYIATNMKIKPGILKSLLLFHKLITVEQGYEYQKYVDGEEFANEQ